MRLLGDFFGPRACFGCEGALETLVKPPNYEARAAEPFCTTCRATLVDAGGPDDVFALWSHEGAAREAVHRLKYGLRSDLATPLGELLADFLHERRDELGGIDVVVPIPLHPARLADRGFNQASLLARPVARKLGASLETSAVRRTKKTSAQASLGRDERLANVESAFVASPSRTITGARILVVDDVVTTGATFHACALALTAAGAKHVAAAALARASSPHSP